MENQSITVGHLLDMQRELLKAITECEHRTGERIEKVADLQRIANGRVGKLEVIVTHLRKHTQDGSFFGSLTKVQKAKVAGFLVLIAGAAAEGIHKAIPMLIELLSGKVGQ